jgi:bifunctional non-homologous end joining protein LigD
MSRVELRQRSALRPSQRQYVMVSPALRLARAAPGARGAPWPGFIEPLLAVERAAVPSGEAWIHEIKWDGYRLQLHKQEAMVRCFTRRGFDWSKRFPTLTSALWPLRTRAAILDGEVVVISDEGETDFGALESYVSSKQPFRRLRNLVFYAFDLLHLDGFDLRDVALLERKRILAALLADLDDESPVKLSEHLDGAGADIYHHACRLGLEGVVSKRVDSRYRSGRSAVWSKVICRNRETFAVAGIAFKGRKFDGIYLAREKDGELVYAGKVEHGFNDRQVKHLQERAAAVKASRPPFEADRAFPKAQWLKPALLADVEYRAKTKRGGLLRHPSYKGLREDLMD